MVTRIFSCLVLLVCFAIGERAAAQTTDIEERRVQFGSATAETIRASLKGYQTIDYLVEIDAGQVMIVNLETDNRSNYFNVMEPDESEIAIHIGSIKGNAFVDQLRQSGDYRIRVYLFRSAARREETANFTLSVEIADADFADGLSGGPDFWEVRTRNADGKLNMRAAPSGNSNIIDTFFSGTVLRNLGCQFADGRRWCRIETIVEPVATGWVAGDFLIESSHTASSPTQSPVNPTDALVTATEFNATGHLPCSRDVGQPMGACEFGVKRTGQGSGSVTIFWSDGASRIIIFEAGNPVSFERSEADGDVIMEVDKLSDLSTITIGAERFEIPDAVIYGG